ncbi:replication protein [Bacillus sp. FJAT-52991]|uniref:Replication protein n=1 Tax=Bacillus kandeliae TaxID=3129297 RepID=A0ABZ2NBL2_9BACI
MADVQLERGYTRVANEILEEVSSRKFNATQLSVLMIVWRMTYGFNRKDHDIALSFFIKATGFSKRNIQEAINVLVKAQILIETQPASFNQTRRITFNKNYDDWLIQSRTKSKQVNDSAPDEEKVTSTGDESCTQERKIKEISKEKDDDLLDKPNPIQEYEKHFGSFPGAMFIQTINDWIDKSQFQEPEEIICETIRRVKLQHPKNPPRYIDQTLSNLHNLELYTLAAVKEYNENYERKIKKQFSSSHSKSFKEMSSRPSGVQEPAPLTEQERQELEALKEDFPF